MMAQQAMGQAYYFYTPEPSPEARHHGHFIAQQQPHHPHAYPHHHPMQQQMQVFPPVPVLPSSPLPSTPVFSRPSSSCSQGPSSQPQVPTSKPSFTSAPVQVLTPQASPVRMHSQLHRPTIVLETTDKFDGTDGLCYPSTPALSTAGSVISSPGSCDMLATPLNPMFSGLEGTLMAPYKEEVEVVVPTAEQFPALDWHSCTSPPMTPSEF